jgi:hypothetical protein
MTLTSGNDTRTPVTIPTTIFPFATIVGVDSNFPTSLDYGSGITIAPSHVLTAGHVVFDSGNLSTPTGTTISNNLAARTSSPNVINQYFPKNFTAPNAPSSSDIALLQTGDSPLTANNTIGLIAFVIRLQPMD